MIKPEFVILPEQSQLNIRGWYILDKATGKALHGFISKAEASRLVKSMEYFYSINVGV
jgi:hypothetical protein